MPRKSIFIALTLTLLSCILVYLVINPTGFLIQTSHLPVIGFAVFVISGISSLAGGRNPSGIPGPSVGIKRQVATGARETGSVKWFNASKGFGFITRDNGEDVFVHFRSIRGQGHRVLHDGQRVEFVVSQGDKGLQAEDVAAAH